MFIETASEAKYLLDLLEQHPSIIHVYYQYPDTHPTENKPIALFVNVLKKNYIASFGHPDLINTSDEYLNMIFKTGGSKVIFDRKKLLYNVSEIKNSIDAYVCSYLDIKYEMTLTPSLKYKDVRSVAIMKLL